MLLADVSLPPARLARPGGRVQLALWCRRDARMMSSWPKFSPDELLLLRSPAGVADFPPNISYAVHLDHFTIGRLSLRSWSSSSYLLGLVLRPDMLGLGLGSDALSTLFCGFPGVSWCLYVHRSNDRALRCYTRSGFLCERFDDPYWFMFRK